MPQAFHPSASGSRSRRGNTIVLVTAILVLLVIIATAFVGRTRAVRQISAAQQSAAGRDSRVESIGVNVAQEIAGALFPKPIDGADPFARVDGLVTPPLVVASASWPRLAPRLDAPRYGIDVDNDGDGLPDLPYNRAPYEVRPWTNWPDFFGPGSPWPHGRGSPEGVLVDDTAATAAEDPNPIGDWNPYGNPGTGDTRWLRSTEPVRRQVGANAAGQIFGFSHWQHLSWLPTANNAWRVVTDIANIEGNAITNMQESPNPGSGRFAVAVPYEQWLAGVIPDPLPAVDPSNPTSAAATSFRNAFTQRRDAWFNNYPSNYRTTNALPNFIGLADVGRPSDEFRADSPRNVVSRTFTDTDGDGFTDSFWFLAPTPVDRGVRTIVGVSIVDNSALVNANVATKFSFDRTTGLTPSDLALVTSIEEYLKEDSFDPFPVQSVGLLDGRLTQSTSAAQNNFFPTYFNSQAIADLTPPVERRFDRQRFGDFKEFYASPIPGNPTDERSTYPLNFLEAIGMRAPYDVVAGQDPRIERGVKGYPLVDSSGVVPVEAFGTFETSRERLAYFKAVGLGESRFQIGLTPFDSSDEFELRAFHGNNFPFALSRFEQALSLYSPGIQAEPNAYQFLRAAPRRQESSEAIDQLNDRQLLLDTRRTLTMFNGARNDVAPPHLWPTPWYSPQRNYIDPWKPVPPGSGAANFDTYSRQTRKIDLRPTLWTDPSNPGLPVLTFAQQTRDNWRLDIRALLERTLIGSFQTPNGRVYETYFGTDFAGSAAEELNRPANSLWLAERTRSMIKSYVANIEAYSDGPRLDQVVDPSTGLPALAVSETADPVLEAIVGTLPGNAGGSPSGVAFEPADPGNPAANPPILAKPESPVYLGMERQPFITEVFYGLCYPKTYLTETELAELNQVIQPNLRGDQRDEFIPSLMNAVVPGGGLQNPSQTEQGLAFVSQRSRPLEVIAIQIANPYDSPLSLSEFRVTFYDRAFEFPAVDLAPATLDGPATATVYGIGDAFSPYIFPNGTIVQNPQGNNFPFIVGQQSAAAALAAADNAQFRAAMLDFLDLERETVDEDGDGVLEYTTLYDSFGVAPDVNPLDRSLVFDATSAFNVKVPLPVTTLRTLRGNHQRAPVEIQRRVGGPLSTRWAVVDRFDYVSPRLEGDRAPRGNPVPELEFEELQPDEGPPEVIPELRFTDAVFEQLFGRNVPPDHSTTLLSGDPNAGEQRTTVNGIELVNKAPPDRTDADFFFTWVRAARPWALDVDTWQGESGRGINRGERELPQNLRTISAQEMSPRYVFAVTTTAEFPTDTLRVWENGRDSGEVRGSAFRWERNSGLEFGDTLPTSSPPAPYQKPASYDPYATGTVEGQRDDPDGTFGTSDYWASMVSSDPFGRLLESKPVFFSNILYNLPSPPPGQRRVAIYSRPSGQSMPFVPKYPGVLDAPNAADYAASQPWHRVVALPDVPELEYTIGGKGYSAVVLPTSAQAEHRDLIRFGRIDALGIPFQMTQKDADFEQIGEVLDVFLWGHVLGSRANVNQAGGQVYEAIQTFSETLVETDQTKYFYPGPAGVYLNRLNFDWERMVDPFPPQGAPAPAVFDRAIGKPYRETEYEVSSTMVNGESYIPWKPALLPGLAFLDGLTIDGSGRRFPDRNLDGAINVAAVDDPATSVIEPLEDELSYALEQRVGLAAGFSGKATPGLVNINTALPETLRALPLMNRLPRVPNAAGQPINPSPYVRVAESIIAYRDKGSPGFARRDVANPGTDSVPSAPTPGFLPSASVGLSNDFIPPSYGDRGLYRLQISEFADSFPVPFVGSDGYRPQQGSRPDSGFGGISELLMTTRTPEISSAPNDVVELEELGLRAGYSIRGFGLDLYDRNRLADLNGGTGQPVPSPEDWADNYIAAADENDFQTLGFGYSLGTDRTVPQISSLPRDQALIEYGLTGTEYDSVPRRYGEPAGDAEDLNKFFAGIGNLVTVRSDVFTVYLRVRQVRQNSVTGVWDGTNPELIVDDSRYVMCIDRSEVNSPSDQPRIVYFQKCPD